MHFHVLSSIKDVEGSQSEVGRGPREGLTGPTAARGSGQERPVGEPTLGERFCDDVSCKGGQTAMLFATSNNCEEVVKVLAACNSAELVKEMQPAP